MDNTKLIEALNDIEFKKRTLEEAAQSIRRALAVLEGVPEVAMPPSNRPGNTNGETRSYIDDAEDVLRSLSRPVHVRDITEAISKLRGTTVARASVESSLIRHIAKTKNPRIKKTRPSTYGLPDWEDQPLLAQAG